jgi:Tfp pilus assembly protein PilW
MLAKIGATSEGLTISLIVIQAIVQVFLKVNMKIMYKLFLNMQMQ